MHLAKGFRQAFAHPVEIVDCVQFIAGSPQSIMSLKSVGVNNPSSKSDSNSTRAFQTIAMFVLSKHSELIKVACFGLKALRMQVNQPTKHMSLHLIRHWQMVTKQETPFPSSVRVQVEVVR